MPNQSVSQSNLETILSRLPSGANLAQSLTSQGYSTNISDINIHFDTNRYIDYSGCQFNNVSFSGKLHDSKFNNAKFNHVSFKNADLSYSTFAHSDFTNSMFSNSKFRATYITHSNLKTTQTWDCDFSYASFHHSNFEESVFVKPKLDNIWNSGNSIKDMHIVFTQDYSIASQFNGATLHQVKPTVAIVSDSEWYSTPHNIISRYNGVPVTIQEDTPNHINERALAAEVKHSINDIAINGLHEPSIAQQVIKSDQPMINAIKKIAYAAVENADAIWIPGGPDLHPEFYGEENTHSYVRQSYYREILEFSLTEAALAANKTILGVCHGSQLVNVYLGGTLHQHVDGQSGIIPILEVKTNDGLLGSVIDGPIMGPSYHHQAVKDVAPTLEVVATYNNVIKATQATDGSKVMLTQFHPEHERDQNSQNILRQFINLSSEDKIKSKMLELGDILHFDNNSIGHLLEQNLPPLASEAPIGLGTFIMDTFSSGLQYAATLPSMITHEIEQVIMA